MRTLYLLLSIYTGLFLSGCSTMDNQDSAAKDQNKPVQHAAVKAKNPLAVAVYTHKKTLTTPYTVIGKAVISKYNPGGIKRQEACIHDAMRDLAARMGGDAVINLAKGDKTVTGTVIAFQSAKEQKLPPV
jgi:uncharacterized protein YceK